MLTAKSVRRRCGVTGAIIALLAATASSVSAQNYSLDARLIGIGGVGTSRNLSSKMVDEVDTYGVIGIPLGLLQLAGDTDMFNPSSDNFNPVRAIQFAANPVHYTFGRNDINNGATLFVTDVINGQLDRDLNRYRGFSPKTHTVAEGLASPTWGKTIPVRRNGTSFHAAYVGGGPYLALQTDTLFDPRLGALLSSPVDIYVPNATFAIANRTRDQLAAAITGGYRSRLALPNSWGESTGRNGIYLAANFNYLMGMHYDDFDLVTRFDTDDQGYLTVAPTTVPIAIDRVTSSDGRGVAVDVGGTAVIDGWEIGAGVRGLGNHITWRDLERRQYVMTSLFDGGEFIETATVAPQESLRAELPIEVTTDASYRTDGWTAATSYAHGYQGHNLHLGLEYGLGRADVRGGVRYSRSYWQPTVGAGVNLSQRVGIDVALFQTRANIEAKPQTAIALALRLNPSSKK